MSEEINGIPHNRIHEPKSKQNGRQNGAAHAYRRTGDPLPGISVRELYTERNWTALAGLGLMGIGLLYLFGMLIDISISLWAFGLLGIGGWLIYDGWQKYQDAGQRWVENSRNRVYGGGLIALIGLLGIMDLNWWGMLLLGVAGWLAYSTWQKASEAGIQWADDPRARNRMTAAGIIGLIGLFGLINLGSAWSWLLIIAGGIMLYRHWRGSRTG